MAISKESYENFRGEVIHLLTADCNLMEEDEIMLNIILESDDPREVLDIARGMKEDGNVLFKDGNYDEALEKYAYAGLISTCFLFEEELRREFCELTTNILLNAALCLSKSREFHQVGRICTVILEFDPKHVKALFWKAMAALELGRKNLALWDLYQASAIDPSNKEVQLKLNQLKSHEGHKHQDGHKRSSPPIGLGLGVPPLKKSSKDTQITKSYEDGNSKVGKDKNEDNLCYSSGSCSSTKDDGLHMGEITHEDTIKECESEMSTADSNDRYMEVSSKEDPSHEKSNPPSNDGVPARVSNEGDKLGPAELKNSDLAESRYRFVNRRKADSCLSICENDYHKLRIGKPLQYFNSKAGAFITIRMVQRPIDKSNKNGESKVSREMQAEIGDQSEAEESIITHEEYIMEQIGENYNSAMDEENADISRADTPMGVEHDNLEVTPGCTQFSPAIPVVCRKQQKVKSRRTKISRPQTLYGVGK